MKSRWETNEPIDDFVEMVGNIINTKYGNDNTFGVTDWQDGVMFFEDDNGQKININEFTLKIQ